MKKIAVSLISLISLLWACSADPQLNPPQVAPNGGGAAGVEAFELPPLGGEWTTTFTGSTAWHMEMSDSGSDWLTVTKNKGKAGTSTISFSAKINTTRCDRTTVVRFISDEGLYEEKITVSQPYPYLRVIHGDKDLLKTQGESEVNDYNFTWDRYRKSNVHPEAEILKVESNVEWRVVKQGGSPVDLLDTLRARTRFGVSVLVGNLAENKKSDSVVEMIPHGQNLSLNPYETAFEIIPVWQPEKEGAYQDIRKASQKGAENAIDGYSLALSQNYLRFLVNGSADEDEYVLTEMADGRNLSVDSEVSWKVTKVEYSDPSTTNWLHFASDNGKANNPEASLAFDVPVNPARVGRSCEILMESTATEGQSGYGAWRKIKVRQKPYVFELLDVFNPLQCSHNFTNNDSRVWTMTVKASSANWEIHNQSTWLNDKIELLSAADSTYSITFNLDPIVGQNMDVNGSIKTSGLSAVSLDNSLNIDFEASQDKFVFTLVAEEAPNNNSLSVATMNMTNHKATLSIDGDWKFTTNVDWVELLDVNNNVCYNGSRGTYTLYVHPTSGNNNLEQSRTGVITITSLNHENRHDVLSQTREISITQKKFTFDIGNQQVFGQQSSLPAYFTTTITPSLTVDCTVPWTMTVYSTDDINWLVPSVSSYDPDQHNGITTCNVSFTCKNHTGKIEPRTATVTITPSAANLQQPVAAKSLTLTQDKFVFDVTPIDYSSLSEVDADSKTFSFDLTAGAPLTPTYPEDWVSYNESSSGGKTTVTLSFANNLNTNFQSRTGSVFISCYLTGETKVITLSQNYFRFDTADENLHFEEVPSGGLIVDVVSSGQWNVDKNGNEWINWEHSGNGIKVSPTVNANLSAREGIIYVYSILHKDAGISLRKPVHISQDKFVFDVPEVNLSDYSELGATARSISVKSSDSWTIKRGDGNNSLGWINASSVSGYGHIGGTEQETINVTPIDNLDTIARSLDIRVQSKYLNLNADLQRTFTVTQKPFVFRLGSGQKAFYYSDPLDQTARAVAVSCSAGWIVEPDEEWLQVISKDDGLFYLRPLQNLTKSKRNGSYTLTSVLSGHKLKVSVSQPEFVFDVKPDQSPLEYSPLPGNIGKSIKVTSSAGWTVSDCPTWVQLSSSSHDSGATNYVETVTVDEYYTTNEAREGNIVFASTLGGYTEMVPVRQNPFIWQIDDSALNLDNPLNTSDFSRSVISSSSDWTCDIDNTDVATVVKSSSSLLTITPKENSTLSARTAIITLQSGYGHSASISINQPAFEWSVQTGDLILDSPVNVSSVNRSVTCSNSNWTCVIDNPAVADVSKNSSGFVITPKVNASFFERVAAVTVDSGYGYSEMINITQPAFVWSVDNTSIELTDALDVTVSDRAVNCSNSEWTVSIDNVDVAKVEKLSSGSGIRVSPKINTTTSPRTATITVSSGYGHTETITVTQPAFVWNVQTDQIETAGPLDETPVLRIVDCSGDIWEVSIDNDNAATVEKVAGGVLITPKVNTETNVRNATITISSGYGHKEVILMSQPAFVWEVQTGMINFSGPLNINPIIRSVDCTVDTWSVSIDNENVASVSKVVGGVQITPIANTSLSTRQAIVTVTSGFGHTAEIKIIQAAFEWSVTSGGVSVQGRTYEISSVSDAITVNVSCSNPYWTFVADQSSAWVKASKASDGKSFSFWTSSNVSDTKIVTMTVSSGNGHSVSFTIKVVPTPVAD